MDKKMIRKLPNGKYLGFPEGTPPMIKRLSICLKCYALSESIIKLPYALMLDGKECKEVCKDCYDVFVRDYASKKGIML